MLSVRKICGKDEGVGKELRQQGAGESFIWSTIASFDVFVCRGLLPPST